MTDDWTPTHFTDADESPPAQQPPPKATPKAAPKATPDPTMPVTLVLALPPHVTIAIADVAENLGRVADLLAKQGEVLQKFVAALPAAPEPPT